MSTTNALLVGILAALLLACGLLIGVLANPAPEYEFMYWEPPHALGKDRALEIINAQGAEGWRPVADGIWVRER